MEANIVVSLFGEDQDILRKLSFQTANILRRNAVVSLGQIAAISFETRFLPVL